MSNRTVLVTGGTGALGTSVVREFLRRGDRVAATWIHEEEAAAMEARFENNDDLFLLPMDATASDSVLEAVGRIDDHFCGIDVLVHLVGAWSGGKSLTDVDDATWDRLMDVNLRSAFNTARAVLPGMRDREWGRLIFVSARTASQDQAGQIPYATSKAAVAALAQGIADETRTQGVTANAIAPSILDTEANRRSFPTADHHAWVTSEEAAASIAFLASEEAGAIRGAVLPLYGAA